MWDSNKNQLDIKDPDCIFLFGNDIQTKINGFTKTISELMLYSPEETAYILMNIKTEVEIFEKTVKKSNKGLTTFINGKINHRNNYSKILSNINQLELALKLQEAKLLKDIKVFKQLIPIMESTKSDLDSLIQYGKHKINTCISVADDEEQQIWVDRLDRRLMDLEVSRTILLQTQEQIKLLMKTNLNLVDKILATIGTTIPIWRTQVALLIGVEEVNEQTILQNKIVTATENQIKENTAILKKSLKKAQNKKDIDLEGIKKINESFIKEINELSDIENKNKQIVSSIKQIIFIGQGGN